MPRNTTGGSGHKARANAEGNATKKNRQLIENFIDDMTKEGKCEGVFVSKVLKKLGDGRMEVSYMDGERAVNIPAPIKGSLRGRGKSQVYIDVGSVVLVSKTGLAGAMSHEIIGVVNAAQLAQLKKMMVLDTRAIEPSMTANPGEIEFGEDEPEGEGEGLIDVDDI